MKDKGSKILCSKNEKQYSVTSYYPEYFMEYDCWILWRLEPGDKGKLTKVPYQSYGKYKASSTKPETWSSFSKAASRYKESLGTEEEYNGLGIVMSESLGVVFIDIDHCVDQDTGEIDERGTEFLELFPDTYAEISQSRSGLHFLVIGDIPQGFNNRSTGIEMYSSGRFCAFTGNAIQACEPHRKQIELEYLYNKYMTHKEDPDPQPKRDPVPISFASDQEILSKAMQHGNFEDLYNGRWEAHYESQSEADLAMCMSLAFWCERDHETIDRIFRTSRLYRKKWDERHGKETYGDMTISLACQRQQITFGEWKQDQKKEQIIMKGLPEDTPDLDTFHHMNSKNEPTGAHDYRICEYLKSREDLFILGQTPYFYEHGVYVTDPDGTKLKTEIKKLIYPQFIRSSTIERIYKLFIIDHSLQQRMETVNQYPAEWINFMNGFYDPVNKKLIEHSPKYRSINQIPHVYDPDEIPESNVIDQWLDFIVPNPDEREMLLQFIGYCMTKDTRQQKFLILTGTGGSGKSTLIRMIESIVGLDNVSNVSLKDLGQRFASYGLLGKLLNSCSDLEVSALEDTSIVKKLLGEDALRAEAKGKDAVSFRSYAKLIFSTNQVPLILSEQTNGFYRRLLILEMNRVPERVLPDFQNLLTSQTDALIHYAVKALERMYEKQTITEAQSSILAVQNLWKSSDTVIAWLSDRCMNDPDSKLERSYLYDNYCDYCRLAGRTALSATSFYRSLSLKNYVQKRTAQTRYFVGIGILESRSSSHSIEAVDDPDLPF